MEDLFDSLIYIIIVIVGFIISLLGKKKKKAQSVSPPKQQIQEQPKEKPFISTLEQLLNEELGIAEEKYENTYEVELQEEEPETILDSPVSKIDTVAGPIDSVPEELLDGKESAPFSVEYDDTSEIFKNAITDKEITDEGDREELFSDFNLKDAIIYSEIINKKEY